MWYRIAVYFSVNGDNAYYLNSHFKTTFQAG